ncbi:hypothetical protein BSLA_01r4986 [Burkholderia stabilis]|nr:hypothetical protein BSLA_01r4986 [Burkholderia stabilis]
MQQAVHEDAVFLLYLDEVSFCGSPWVGVAGHYEACIVKSNNTHC